VRTIQVKDTNHRTRPIFLQRYRPPHFHSQKSVKNTLPTLCARTFIIADQRRSKMHSTSAPVVQGATGECLNRELLPIGGWTRVCFSRLCLYHTRTTRFSSRRSGNRTRASSQMSTKTKEGLDTWLLLSFLLITFPQMGSKVLDDIPLRDRGTRTPIVATNTRTST
jgi:hypothetical protein